MVRSILGVVLGVLLGFVIVVALEALNASFVYPPPPGLDPKDLEALKAHAEKAPTGALLVVLLGWALAPFAGAWLAAWIAGRAPLTHGLIVGGIFLAATISNFFLFPHPLWLMIAGVVVPPLTAYAGCRLVKPRPAPTP